MIARAFLRSGDPSLSHTGAELIYEVFSQCYERGAILVTINLPFNEWMRCWTTSLTMFASSR